MAIRAITFDVYSALYDAVSGLQRALAALLQARGTAGDPAALARTWRQRHMEYLLIANSLELEPARNRTALDARPGRPSRRCGRRFRQTNSLACSMPGKRCRSGPRLSGCSPRPAAGR